MGKTKKYVLTGEERLAQKKIDDHIRQVATAYLDFEKRAPDQAKQWLNRPGVDASILSGGDRSIRMKLTGLRPLTKQDVNNLFGQFGDESSKQQITLFSQAQQQFNERLQKSPYIGLILSQASIHYNSYYEWLKRPDLWSAEDMIRILSILERLDI